jgi:hypothetical protein
MAFYGKAKQMEGSISGTALSSTRELTWQEDKPLEVADFDGLAAHTGVVIIRMPAWDAFVADVTVTLSADSSVYESVSISWRRVRNSGYAI